MILWIALGICVFGAVICLRLLFVDKGRAWDLAQSIKKGKKCQLN